MASDQDVFVQMNNALLDLQRADFQTWERPLKRLAGFLRHPDLEPFNARLTEGLDLEAFLAESSKTGGSMVGSHRLAWPESDRETLGLTLLLIEKMASNTSYAIEFSHHYFYSNSKIISGIRSMTSNMLIPFVRDYKAYVMSAGIGEAGHGGSSELGRTGLTH